MYERQRQWAWWSLSHCDGAFSLCCAEVEIAAMAPVSIDYICLSPSPPLSMFPASQLATVLRYRPVPSTAPPALLPATLG